MPFRILSSKAGYGNEAEEKDRIEDWVVVSRFSRRRAGLWAVIQTPSRLRGVGLLWAARTSLKVLIHAPIISKGWLTTWQSSKPPDGKEYPVGVDGG
jgi:hypothetical protein